MLRVKNGPCAPLRLSSMLSRPATGTTRIWLQQELWDKRLSIRAGQIAADDEFFVSQTATLFINSTFGWPAILGINLPSGGPAYPLADTRRPDQSSVHPALTVAFGAFNGDPAPAGQGNPQQLDPSGTTFRLKAVGSYSASWRRISISGPTNTLSRNTQVGGWYHTGVFSDQRYDTMEVRSQTLPAPATRPCIQAISGGYAVVDQVLWRPTGTSDRGLSAFVRLGGVPPTATSWNSTPMPDSPIRA